MGTLEVGIDWGQSQEKVAFRREETLSSVAGVREERANFVYHVKCLLV